MPRHSHDNKRRKQRRGFACMPPAQVAEIARLGGIAVSRCALCDAGFPLVDGYHVPTQRLGPIPVTFCKKAHMAAIGALGGSRRKHWRKGTRRSKPPAVP